MTTSKGKEADSPTNKPKKTSQAKSTTKRPLSDSPAPTSKRPRTSNPPASTNSTTKQFSYIDLPKNWHTHPTNWHTHPTNQPTGSNLVTTHHNSDIFSNLGSNTLLIHACNTQGVWGAGIAKAFKANYPAAYQTHREFCLEQKKVGGDIVGTAQLVRTNDGEDEDGVKSEVVWVGCLFTSRNYGKKRDKADEIVRNTVRAVGMLLELVNEVEQQGEKVGDVRMCKVNSGKFGVEWDVTESALKGIEVKEGWRGEVGVWSVE